MQYLYLYLLLINALTFLIMLLDKQRARKKHWRIPEATLLALCAAGGSLGGFMSMQLFRHKTKHLSFAIGIPAMLFVHIGLLIHLHM